MRKLFGFGTPKQLAALARALFSLLSDLLAITATIISQLAVQLRFRSSTALGARLEMATADTLGIRCSSTGC